MSALTLKSMTKPLTRRRFLSVCAMAGAYGAMPWSAALAASAPLHHWRGILLGADVSLSLAHPDKKEASRLFSLCVKEIKRLEDIFTLYDSQSALSRLNREGFLSNPAPEMLDIFEKAQRYHTLTDGAFDITVQPLWALYQTGSITKNNLQKTLPLIGMDKVEIEKKAIVFSTVNMAVTLNGIAQGYITDHITELLKDEGLTNVLVELGEKRAIGGHPSGRPWRIGLNNGDDIYKNVPLKDYALATSMAQTPLFVGERKTAHIFDPRTGLVPARYKSLSVMAKTAAMADALSTGFTALSLERIKQIASSRNDIGAYYLS